MNKGTNVLFLPSGERINGEYVQKLLGAQSIGRSELRALEEGRWKVCLFLSFGSSLVAHWNRAVSHPHF